MQYRKARIIPGFFLFISLQIVAWFAIDGKYIIFDFYWANACFAVFDFTRKVRENEKRGVLKMAIDIKNTTKPNASYWQPGMRLFLRLSGWIGGPILLAVVVGKYLDAKYHTDPWLFLFSVGIAFCISTWAIIHYGLKEMKRIESEISGTSE